MPFVQTRYDLHSKGNAAIGRALQIRPSALQLSRATHSNGLLQSLDTNGGDHGEGSVQPIPPILRLPQEVHDRILSHCCKETLLRARLVSRGFSEKTSDGFICRFFQNCHFRMSTYAINALEEILASERFRSKLRQIAFRPCPILERINFYPLDETRRLREMGDGPAFQAVGSSQMRRVLEKMKRLDICPAIVWTRDPGLVRSYRHEEQADLQLDLLFDSMEKSFFRPKVLKITSRSCQLERDNIEALSRITTLELNLHRPHDIMPLGEELCLRTINSCPLLQHLKLEFNCDWIPDDNEEIFSALSQQSLVSFDVSPVGLHIKTFRRLLLCHQSSLKSLRVGFCDIMRSESELGPPELVLSSIFQDLARAYDLHEVRFGKVSYFRPGETLDRSVVNGVVWKGRDAVKAGLQTVSQRLSSIVDEL